MYLSVIICVILSDVNSNISPDVNAVVHQDYNTYVTDHMVLVKQSVRSVRVYIGYLLTLST